MENERWKLRICLLTIVLAAVMFGLFYYAVKEPQKEQTGGVLVGIDQGEDHGC